jgi:hypothetical protein
MAFSYSDPQLINYSPSMLSKRNRTLSHIMQSKFSNSNIRKQKTKKQSETNWNNIFDLTHIQNTTIATCN